jgi:polysaccharide biosynthesis protein PslG
MVRHPLKLAIAPVLMLCLLAAPARGHELSRPQARPAGASLLGGINIGGVEAKFSPREADRTMALAHQLHARVVRLEVPWSAMEPSGPGQIDPRALANTDRVAEDAAAAGIRIIMMVESTPCWASSAPPSLSRKCVPSGASKANSWPPRDPSAFAAFAAYLARRYRAELAAIEVWNEPDQTNELYFAGPSKPARYAALLRAAYPAIKQADPGALVLAGSLVGSNGAFLRALYAAGIKGYYDGLAVHYYNLTLASVRSIHEVQLANGDTTQLWLDEFGWASCWPGRRIEQEQACVTSQTQARNITNTFRALAGAPYVAAAVIYKLRDSGAEDFGLLSASGAHKPAFAALAHVLSAPVGSLGRVTLSLRRRGARVLANGSAPFGDFMQLEVFQGSLLRYRALFTLDRFNRYSLVLPAVLGTHGLRVRVYDYWSGPAAGAQASI